MKRRYRAPDFVVKLTAWHRRSLPNGSILLPSVPFILSLDWIEYFFYRASSKNRGQGVIMRILGLLLASLQFASVLFSAATADPTEVQQILSDAVDSRRTVGIVVGIVDARGQTVFSSGKTAADGRGVDGDTVFEIASVTKTFTATLLADMVRQGLVKLDDPVARFLPENVKMPARGGKEITLLDLATHRSGLPRLPANWMPANPFNPYADYTAERLYAFLSSYALPRDIGAGFEYSNLGSGLLGEALARKAGKSYEALLAERILRPLEMHNSGITLRPETSARLAQGHFPGLAAAMNWDTNVLAGCHAIHSTANDMLKYIAAYMGLKDSPLAGAMAAARQEIRDTDAPNLRIGLAWHILKLPDASIVWHNGGSFGYHSFVGFDLKKGMGVVVLSNCMNDIDDIGFHILNDQIPLAKAEVKK
jgi:CubicO group peptidase (beta-lactamase class C family)